MKRFISILSLVAVLLTAMPVHVSASASVKSDTLIEKACVAFPEYAAKLHSQDNNIATYSAAPSQRILVINETRFISDNESISYAEYSDGLILLSGCEFVAESTLVDRVTNSTSTNITIDIEAACVFNNYTYGYFYLDNVSYSLISSGFDKITNTGTPRKTGYCTMQELFPVAYSESLTSYATLPYHLAFRLNSSGSNTVDSVLVLFVGEDTAVLNHVDYNDYV